MTGRDYRHLVKLHRESNLKNNDDNLKVLSKLADTNLGNDHNGHQFYF